MPLYQVGPNTWSNRPPGGVPAARSDLPIPNVISDTIDPVEQVDGKFYTSKRQFRAVGRAHGLTEVGNEKPKKKTFTDDAPRRRKELKTALDKFKAGHRPGGRYV